MIERSVDVTNEHHQHSSVSRGRSEDLRSSGVCEKTDDAGEETSEEHDHTYPEPNASSRDEE